MLVFLKQNFKRIDLIGPQVGLESTNSNRYKTNLGAFSTFLVLISIIVISILFGQEIYKREKPSLSSIKKLKLDSSISISDLSIYFGITTNDGMLIENPQDYIHIKTSYVNSDVGGSDSSSFNIINCSNHEALNEHINENYNKSNLLCFTYNNEIQINNDLFSENSKSLQFSIFSNICNTNDIDISNYDRNCTSSSSVPYSLNKLKFLLYYNSSYLNSDSYNNPIFNVTEHYSVPLSSVLKKNMKVDFSKNTLTSDNGWIIEDKYTYNLVQLDNIDTQYSQFTQITDNTTYSKNEEELLIIQISSTNLITKFTRRYLKIQDLFAQIGGIATVAIALFQFLFYHYLRFGYIRSMYFILNEDNNDFSFHKDNNNRNYRDSSKNNHNNSNVNGNFNKNIIANNENLHISDNIKFINNRNVVNIGSCDENSCNNKEDRDNKNLTNISLYNANKNISNGIKIISDGNNSNNSNKSNKSISNTLVISNINSFTLIPTNYNNNFNNNRVSIKNNSIINKSSDDNKKSLLNSVNINNISSSKISNCEYLNLNDNQSFSNSNNMKQESFNTKNKGLKNSSFIKNHSNINNKNEAANNKYILKQNSDIKEESNIFEESNINNSNNKSRQNSNKIKAVNEGLSNNNNTNNSGNIRNYIIKINKYESSDILNINNKNNNSSNNLILSNINNNIIKCNSNFNSINKINNNTNNFNNVNNSAVILKNLNLSNNEDLKLNKPNDCNSVENNSNKTELKISDFSYKGYLLSLLCCKKDKMKLYMSITERIESKLDIVTYCKLLSNSL